MQYIYIYIHIYIYFTKTFLTSQNIFKKREIQSKYLPSWLLTNEEAKLWTELASSSFDVLAPGVIDPALDVEGASLPSRELSSPINMRCSSLLSASSLSWDIYKEIRHMNMRNNKGFSAKRHMYVPIYGYFLLLRLHSRTLSSHIVAFKGVLHPRLVFGLFLHFSQKVQHIGNR